MGKPANPGTRALVADIGGTNARLALVDLETLEISEIRQFPCAEHNGIEAAAEIYLAGLKERPRQGALATAPDRRGRARAASHKGGARPRHRHRRRRPRLVRR
jgi:glucokinase